MSTDTCDVVGIGENSIDLVYRLTALPGPNDKVRVSSCRRLPGGQVATTLCTCAALGLRTKYIGTFGSGEYGTLIRAELEQRGINTSHARARYAPNRHAVILVDERTGDRSVMWQRDAALTLRPEEVTREMLAGAEVLHVDNVDEDTAIAAARMARDAGIRVTTDIDQITGRTMELIAAATLPILAERIPQALSGKADLERALRAIRHRPDQMLCVTLGAQGSMLLADDQIYRAPAFRVDPIDTTGAGDVFRGAMIYSLLRGDAPDVMLRFANAAAAVSCTREGAIGGVPRLQDIEKLMAMV